MRAEEKVQGDVEDKENWRNKLGLPHMMGINVALHYSYLREKLLRLTHDAL